MDVAGCYDAAPLPMNIGDLLEWHVHAFKQISEIVMNMVVVTTVQVYGDLRVTYTNNKTHTLFK